MKKNAMLKIAAVLLVAVLLTTCAISSTFAKYVSKEQVFTDTTRIAKWGIKINAVANDQDLFVNDYTDAVANEAIIAPGTAKSITVAGLVEGIPEVDCVVNYYVKVVKTGLDDYDPTNLKVSTISDPIQNDTWTLASTKTYKANNEINDAATFNISWNWKFEDEGAQNVIGDNGPAVGSTDYKDTFLAGENASIAVAVYVEVIQVNPSSNFAN